MASSSCSYIVRQNLNLSRCFSETEYQQYLIQQDQIYASVANEISDPVFTGILVVFVITIAVYVISAIHRIMNMNYEK